MASKLEVMDTCSQLYLTAVENLEFGIEKSSDGCSIMHPSMSSSDGYSIMHPSKSSSDGCIMHPSKSSSDGGSSMHSSKSSPCSLYKSAVAAPVLNDDELKAITETSLEAEESLHEDKQSLINMHILIKRSTMFYGQKVTWPKNLDDFINAIFSYKVGQIEVEDKRLPVVKTRLKTLLEKGHEFLCKKHNAQAPEFENDLLVTSLLQLYHPAWQVYVWLRSLLKASIPVELLGNSENFNRFLKSVQELVYRGRYDKISIGEAIKGIKVTQCKWLPNKMHHQHKEVMVTKVIVFMMERVCLGLVTKQFYVTEDSTHRSRLFYYHKKVWNMITKLGVNELCTSRFMKPIDEKQVKESMQEGQILAVSKLRFLPKPSGIRPIINMSSKSRSGPNKSFSVNQLMGNVLTIFICEKRRNPELVGSSVWNRSDVYTKWKQFVETRKRHGDSRPLYFVKVDISRCFETIDAKKVFDLVSNKFLTQDEYIILRHAQVHQDQGQMKRTFIKEAIPLQEYRPDFQHYAKHRVKKLGLKNAVLIDQVHHVIISKELALDRLQKHLFNNVLQNQGDKCTYLHQVFGIPQGSVLSTMLCNLYYGQMEKLHLKGVCKIEESDTKLLGNSEKDGIGKAPTHIEPAAKILPMKRVTFADVNPVSQPPFKKVKLSNPLECVQDENGTDDYSEVISKYASAPVNINLCSEKVCQEQPSRDQNASSSSVEGKLVVGPEHLKEGAGQRKVENSLKRKREDESKEVLSKKTEESAEVVFGQGDGEILMRQVDDFFFATPSLSRAKDFLHKMNKGFPDFNCYVNKTKTVVNFECEDAARVPTGAFVPWLGLLFDPAGNGVTFDLSRLRDLTPDDQLTFDASSHGGVILRQKMIRYVCSKLNLILWDPVVNHENMIITSVYKHFYTAAIRLKAYMRRLPQANLIFIIELILELPQIFWNKVYNWLGYQWLPLSILKWLCLQACSKCFEKNKAEWPNLVKAIKLQLRRSKLSATKVQHLKNLTGQVTDLPELC